MHQAPFKSLSAITMALTTTTASIAIPARGNRTDPRQIKIYNPSTTLTAYFRVGDSTITAVVVDDSADNYVFFVPPGGFETFTIRPGTHIAGISGGSVTVVMMVGEGYD